MRQPWAWAIIHGGKDVENRTRNLTGSYRGPLAIHAGARWSEEGARSELVAGAFVDQAAREVEETTGHTIGDLARPVMVEMIAKDLGPTPDFFVPGAFLGVVDLVDVHEAFPDAEDGTFQGPCCLSPWAQYNAGVHLMLANPRPLPEPIPARGMQCLWTPPADVLEQLQAAVDA